MRAVVLVAAAMVGLIALAACGAPAPEVPPAEPSPAPVIQVPTVGPGDGAIQSHLATKVLEVGTQRVAFLLNTQKALVKAPQVSILVAPTDESGPATEITADYNAWPYGVRGSYVAPVYFPSPGDYRADGDAGGRRGLWRGGDQRFRWRPTRPSRRLGKPLRPAKRRRSTIRRK